MRRTLGVAAFSIALGAMLAAQSPAMVPATAPAAPQPQTSRRVIKPIIFAGVAGAAAGILIGTRGLSFAQVQPPGTVGAHRFRAGLTYGLIGGVGAAALAATWVPTDQANHPFWWSRSTTPLWAGIAAVQVLDYTSTRYFRNRGKDEYLLTNQLVDNPAAFAATEASAVAAGIGLSYLLHHSGHHKLERWFAAGYIGFGISSAVANYRYPTTGHGLF